MFTLVFDISLIVKANTLQATFMSISEDAAEPERSLLGGAP